MIWGYPYSWKHPYTKNIRVWFFHAPTYGNPQTKTCQEFPDEAKMELVKRFHPNFFGPEEAWIENLPLDRDPFGGQAVGYLLAKRRLGEKPQISWWKVMKE